MGFQLVISEGKEAGREFVFEQTSILIGRTSECDVVLYDPGVSRKHARIFLEGTAYFVEDMGSSNGTKVNGSIVKKKELADGDSVALGPVVFSFSATELEEPTNPGAAPDQSTRIVSAEDVQRSRNKGVALVPSGTQPEELEQLGRSATRTMQAVSRPRVSNPGMARMSNPGLARVSALDTTDSVNSGARALRKVGTPLTAADRARIRRESSPLGAAAKIFWAEATNKTRYLIMGGAALAGCLVLVGGLVLALSGDDGRRKLPPEPTTLGTKAVEFSFGHGEAVDYERPDQKIFAFDFTAATKAMVVLHFQSMDISQDEVVIAVNGVDVGRVPADTMNAKEVSHETLVPPSALKKGEKNLVSFDNVHNPPDKDPWRIWNIRLEVVLLPEGTAEQLTLDAKNVYARAQRTWEQRDIGARNRYEAWKDYRTVWLFLESLPEPRPEMYHLARQQVREVQAELDRTCAKLLLESEMAYNLKRFEEARRLLEHVRDWFPGNDQPCVYRAEQKRMEWQL